MRRLVGIIGRFLDRLRNTLDSGTVSTYPVRHYSHRPCSSYSMNSSHDFERHSAVSIWVAIKEHVKRLTEMDRIHTELEILADILSITVRPLFLSIHDVANNLLALSSREQACHPPGKPRSDERSSPRARTIHMPRDYR